MASRGRQHLADWLKGDRRLGTASTYEAIEICGVEQMLKAPIVWTIESNGFRDHRGIHWIATILVFDRLCD